MPVKDSRITKEEHARRENDTRGREEARKVEAFKRDQGRSQQAQAGGAVVSLNAAKNGVEVPFPGRKPDASIISQLKGAGFHWTFKGGGCWYKRQSPESIAFANKLAGIETIPVKQEAGPDRFDMAVEDWMAEACGA